MDTNKRSEVLKTIAASYVQCLASGDFDSIPYADDVELRAPLCPNGSNQPLVGKHSLREQWWAPLPDLVSDASLIDIFVNDSLSSVAVEFHCRIDSASCTLRVMDRFRVNEAGKITVQENFFDPRDVTNPGWNQA